MYVVGETGILEELDLKGISYIGGPADADKKVELKPGYFLEHDKDVRRLWELLAIGGKQNTTT